MTRTTYVLRAARILEPRSGDIVRGGFLVVRGACIVGVNSQLPKEAEAIDLGDVTLLPGLIDMHTHLLLRDEDQKWPYSILWKTSPYRIIEGVDAAIKTVNIGFRISQPKDSSLLEARCKDLAAVTDVLRRNHKNEYASDFQPSIRVDQEHPFQAFASTFADSPVVGRI